jgi:DNA (cytosine-5)-methyltransferase 1
VNVAPRPPRTSISVCSGVGGLDLGLSSACGVEPVVYIEREAFAAACLVARMEEARLAPAPLWDDVCTFDARPWRGLVDLVAGGTPCQDLSLAGKRRGLDGERSRLFFEHVRIAVECEAPLFFWENVAGATRVVPRVCEYLGERGYRGAWAVVRASDVGAPHERARIFLLAYSEGFAKREPHHAQRAQPRGWAWEDAGGRGVREVGDPALAHGHGHGHGREGERRGVSAEHHASHPDGRGGASPVLANTNGQRRQGDRVHGRESGSADPSPRLAHTERQGLALGPRLGGDARQEQPTAERGGLPRFPPGPDDRDAWGRVLAIRPDLAPALPAQPRLRGVDDGLAGGMGPALRADRLRACGNGVVPEQAAHAWRGLWRELFGN